MSDKKFCINCANNKKDGLVTPSADGRCPVCNSDSLITIDAVTKLLGSKTNSPSLSVQEENTLISEFSSSDISVSEADKKRPASKPVLQSSILYAVSFITGKATFRCVRFAESAVKATLEAMSDVTQPWYLHEGKLDSAAMLIKCEAVKREKLERLGS